VWSVEKQRNVIENVSTQYSNVVVSDQKSTSEISIKKNQIELDRLCERDRSVERVHFICCVRVENSAKPIDE